MPNMELYGTRSCPYTDELREWLEWKGVEFTEYDVDSDLKRAAYSRPGRAAIDSSYAGGGRQGHRGGLAGPWLRGGQIMHELSIAMSIVEMAEEEAERRGNAQIQAVYLRLGRLAGVVKEALLSSYEMACETTLLAGSQLVSKKCRSKCFARSARPPVRCHPSSYSAAPSVARPLQRSCTEKNCKWWHWR